MTKELHIHADASVSIVKRTGYKYVSVGCVPVNGGDEIRSCSYTFKISTHVSSTHAELISVYIASRMYAGLSDRIVIHNDSQSVVKMCNSDYPVSSFLGGFLGNYSRIEFSITPLSRNEKMRMKRIRKNNEKRISSIKRERGTKAFKENHLFNKGKRATITSDWQYGMMLDSILSDSTIEVVKSTGHRGDNLVADRMCKYAQAFSFSDEEWYEETYKKRVNSKRVNFPNETSFYKWMDNVSMRLGSKFGEYKNYSHLSLVLIDFPPVEYNLNRDKVAA